MLSMFNVQAASLSNYIKCLGLSAIKWVTFSMFNFQAASLSVEFRAGGGAVDTGFQLTALSIEGILLLFFIQFVLCCNFASSVKVFLGLFLCVNDFGRLLSAESTFHRGSSLFSFSFSLTIHFLSIYGNMCFALPFCFLK